MAKRSSSMISSSRSRRENRNMVRQVVREENARLHGGENSSAIISLQEEVKKVRESTFKRQLAQQQKAYALDMPEQFRYQEAPFIKPFQRVTFHQLRQLATTYDILASCIAHIKDQVIRTELDFVPKDEKDETPETKNQVEAAEEFFAMHGGLGGHGKTRLDFEGEWIDDLLVIGSVAMFMDYETTGALSQGNPDRVLSIDSSTIRPLIDPYGFPPPESEVAYEQYIRGVRVEEFTRHDLIYAGLPIFRATYTPFYSSAVEQLVLLVISALKADDWNRTWLTDGNAPDFMLTIPNDWSTEQMEDYMQLFGNWLNGNNAMRHRAIIVPEGTQGNQQTRKDSDFQEFEKWLRDRACSLMGVSQASIGHASDTYKVSQDGQMDNTRDNRVAMVLQTREILYNDIARRKGWDRIDVISKAGDSEDKASKAQRHSTEISSGLRTINETRREDGEDPDPSPNADLLLITGGLVPLNQLGQMPGQAPPGGQNPDVTQAITEALQNGGSDDDEQAAIQEAIGAGATDEQIQAAISQATGAQGTPDQAQDNSDVTQAISKATGVGRSDVPLGYFLGKHNLASRIPTELTPELLHAKEVLISRIRIQHPLSEINNQMQAALMNYKSPFYHALNQYMAYGMDFSKYKNQWLFVPYYDFNSGRTFPVTVKEAVEHGLTMEVALNLRALIKLFKVESSFKVYRGVVIDQSKLEFYQAGAETQSRVKNYRFLAMTLSKEYAEQWVRAKAMQQGNFNNVPVLIETELRTGNSAMDFLHYGDGILEPLYKHPRVDGEQEVLLPNGVESCIESVTSEAGYWKVDQSVCVEQSEYSNQLIDTGGVDDAWIALMAHERYEAPQETQDVESKWADEPDEEDDNPVPGQEQVNAVAQRLDEIKRWEKKCLNRLDAGKAPQCLFHSDNLEEDFNDRVYFALLECETKDDIRRVFSEEVLPMARLWNPLHHPRGKPENAGQFSAGGSAGSAKKDAPAAPSAAATKPQVPKSRGAVKGKLRSITDKERNNYNEKLRSAGEKPIPPGLTDVEIPADGAGHSEVLWQGRGKKHQLTYGYSDAYSQSQQAAKFHRVAQIEEKLPDIKNAIAHSLKEGTDYPQAMATLLMLLTGFRNGGDGGHGKVKAYGTSNMLSEFVKVNGTKVTFDFIGKKGEPQHHTVDDPIIAKYAKARLKGGNKKFLDTTTEKNKTYLRKITGMDDAIAHDLRTRMATAMATHYMNGVLTRDPDEDEAGLKKAKQAVTQKVADKLGDTNSVTEGAYIHKTVWPEIIRDAKVKNKKKE